MNGSASIGLRLLLGVMLVSAGTPGNFAWAADAATTDTDQTDQTDQTGQNPTLQTVVVTAEKRAENLQDVPISMMVVNNQTLTGYNIRDVLGLQALVPNLLVQQATVPYQFFIRGFGSQSANDAFEQSVSVYVDGIYGGRNRQFMQPFFDVDQVEVLRGPQGALLGKNTAAGAIVITTANPTDTFHAGADFTYSFERNGEDVFAFVSGPLADQLNGRLAVHLEDMPGWVYNTATNVWGPDNHTVQVRPSLEWKPADGIDILAKYDFNEVFYTGNNLVRTSVTEYSVTTTKNAPPPFGIPDLDRTTSNNASINARFALGQAGTLESITGYSAYDNRYNLGATAGTPESFVVGFVSDFNQYSQEIRLVSPTQQPIEYIVGVYADTGKFDTNNTSTYNFGSGFAGAVETIFSQRTNTQSAFAQATWHVTDALRAIGSLRYTHESKSANFAEDTLYGVPIATAPMLSGSESENHVDPLVTLQYDLTKDVMLYATYGQGSKGGGFVSNTRTVVASDFQYRPETSKNTEVGIKSTFLDQRLLLNVSLYDTRFHDLQVTTFDPTLITYITSNAASATSRGVEWTFAWLILPGLQLTTSGAYLDAKYDNFPGAQCLATTPPSECSPAGTTNLAGTTILGASKWTGNGQLDYKHPLTGGWDFDASAMASYRSGYFISADQNPLYGYQPSYWKYDANISFSKGGWNVALIGKNLSNKLTKNFSYNFSGIGVADVDPTRDILLQVRVRF